MREVPLAEYSGTLGLARVLVGGDFDVVIFPAGVGPRAFLKAVEIRGEFKDIASSFRLTWNPHIQKWEC